MVGEGAQVLCGGPRGKFSKLGARSGPHTRSAHLIPSQSDVLKMLGHFQIFVSISQPKPGFP